MYLDNFGTANFDRLFNSEYSAHLAKKTADILAYYNQIGLEYAQEKKAELAEKKTTKNAVLNSSRELELLIEIKDVDELNKAVNQVGSQPMPQLFDPNDEPVTISTWTRSLDELPSLNAKHMATNESKLTKQNFSISSGETIGMEYFGEEELAVTPIETDYKPNPQEVRNAFEKNEITVPQQIIANPSITYKFIRSLAFEYFGVNPNNSAINQAEQYLVNTLNNLQEGLDYWVKERGQKLAVIQLNTKFWQIVAKKFYQKNQAPRMADFTQVKQSKKK